LNALLLATLLTSGAPNPELRWGADSQGGAPYVFQDPTDPNHLIGFEVELADGIARRLGMKARPVHGPWDKLLDLLARGDFDIALNGIEVAEEKKRIVLLSRPYFSAAERLTIRKGDAKAPHSLEDLRGRKIGTLPGSMAETILNRVAADVKTYEGGQDEIYDDLKLGRTDGVLLDGPVATYYGDIDPVLEDVPGEYGSVDYAIAFKLDDDALRVRVNTALEQMGRDGSLRTLYEKWGIWNPQVARLLGDPDGVAHHTPDELDRWRAAVGKLPPFWERVRTRYPAVLPLFLEGALLSVAVSMLAMLMAIVLGVALAMGRRYGPKLLQVVCVAYIEFFRGTPLLIQLTMVYFGLPELGLKLSPFVAGVVALGLNYAAAEAENYRAGLESVPGSQLEAATVLGLSRWQSLRHVVAPQAVRISIPPMTNDFIALLKDSSLVSLVTLTELTKTYSNLSNSMRDHLGLGLLVAICYLLIGLPFAQLARKAESHFARHLKRGVA
jgi:polar amino acid transport system substrate-binding protein